MLRTRKQKHSKQCMQSFSWQMGLEAERCPSAAVCWAVLSWAGLGCAVLGRAGQAAHCRIKAGDAFVIKANTKSS